MEHPQVGALLDRLRAQVGYPHDGPEDARLLEQFVVEGDEVAFRRLVQRYQRMVLGVCRRVLNNEQDAEDAFQATFLVLARKAASLTRRGALPGWLHQVAFRCALRARNRARLHRQLEQDGAEQLLADMPCRPEPSAEHRELAQSLDAEIQLLPERYRTPLVLCCLDGKTYDQAARQLGWPLGTVSTRLSKAREVLRYRLAKRGLTLPASLFAVLSQRTVDAAPVRLLESTLQTVAAPLQKWWPVNSAVALAQGELRTMLVKKLALFAVGILTATALVLGIGPSTSPAPSNSITAAPLAAAAAPRPEKEERQADWLLFRGNPLQTGVADTRLPDKLEVLWTFKAKDSIENAPAVSKGVVYLGTMDEHLYALDLATGKEKWKYRAAKDAGFKASPSVKGNTVYCGDTDGFLHAIDATKGAKLWKFETGAEITSGANFHGDRILFGSGDECLYCLTSDGKLSWKFKVPGGPVMATPAIADGKTFVAGCDSALHVIELDKGTELASVELAGQVGATAAVVKGCAYVGTMVQQVQAVDLKTMKVNWTFEPERGGQPFAASIAATEQLVIAASRDKRVYALDRATGKKEWEVLTRGRIESSPVIAGKRVYVGSGDKNFYVLDLASGRIVQKLELDDEVTGSPAVVGERLLIGTRSGMLYCLGAK